MWSNIKIFIHQLVYIIKCWLKLIKGQLPEYEILMESHRLEKGLLHDNPKPKWGWIKANRIANLIESCNDTFACDTGKGVLSSYIQTKRNTLDENYLVDEFLNDHSGLLEDSTLNGGIQVVKYDDIKISQEDRIVVEKFFKGRHSAREFSPEIVRKEDLEHAIALAIQCPSACNRQPTRLYVYQKGGTQSICLAVNIRAYETGEFNDWIVSPSIFAGYLTLALHLYGIGSCVMRKPLYGRSDYTDLIRDAFNMSKDEVVVIEIVFGYYKEEFKAAVSRRHKVDEIAKFS